jgi:hypothetical protein
MQELILADLDEPLHNIPHEAHDLPLAHPTLLLQQRTEIALVAELSDDIAMRSLTDDIEALEDIGMLQLSQRLDLAVQHLATDRITHALHIDSLNGHGFICMGEGVLVVSLVPR